MSGQKRTTFSYEAYLVLSKAFRAPKVTDENSPYMSAERNDDILPTLMRTGGYGVIAMDTKAEGNVLESVKPFFALLGSGSLERPFTIIGAIRMKIHFALMVRKGVKKEDIKTVIAHKKAFGACQQKISSLGWECIESPNNGKAAEDVATKEECKEYAALGTLSAAEIYGLSVLEYPFEEETAITTFFLLGPKIRNRQ